MTWEEAKQWLQATALSPHPIRVAKHRVIDNPGLWRQAVLVEMASLEQRPPWRGLDPAAWEARRRALLGDVAEVRKAVER